MAAASDAGEPQSVEELTPAEAPPARSTALSLSPLWVAEGFEQPEGVALDPEGNYFISNIGSGGGADKDGDGYISVVYQEGEIAIERWAEGLDAPKGMQVHDGTLYVADVDKIRRFDMYSGAAFDPISVVGAELLEDVTVWQEQIYVSDSRTSRIYRLTDDTAEVWKEDPALQGVNGLLGDGDRMLIATMATGTLYAASFDGTLSSIADGMIDADGIGVTSDGSYLVSSRPGEIYTVSEEGEVSSLLNTRVNGISQNDLTVFGNTVIVPNWQANTVSAWRITR
ncbi:MAG: hypothetical protein AAF986_04465 [Pseudomonadota bacterium]